MVHCFGPIDVLEFEDAIGEAFLGPDRSPAGLFRCGPRVDPVSAASLIAAPSDVVVVKSVSSMITIAALARSCSVRKIFPGKGGLSARIGSEAERHANGGFPPCVEWEDVVEGSTRWSLLCLALRWIFGLQESSNEVSEKRLQ